MSNDELNLVQWFFLRLQAMYGNKFQTVYPDDNMVKMAKKEWADEISRKSQEELDRAFSITKQRMIDGEQDARWPDPAYILGNCPSSRSRW